MYDYAYIEMINVHNATFPLVLLLYIYIYIYYTILLLLLLRTWYDSEITDRRKYL